MTAITLLDGGLGQELVSRSAHPPHSLWGTYVMMEEPHILREVHEEYFGVGADVVTTNTYAIHPDRLQIIDIEDRYEELHETACRIAVEARDATSKDGKIAGSLGPLGMSYRPDLAPEPEIAAEYYANMVRLHEPYVDIVLLETMCSVDQADGALMGAKSGSKPVWLGISVDDKDGSHLRSGEPLSALEPIITRHRPDAILINCSIPEAVTTGLKHLSRFGVPFGGYANGFTEIASDFRRPGATVDLLTSRTDLGPKTYANFCDDWVAAGASIVGGCCEVGPAHIAEIQSRRAMNNQKTAGASR
ncbi:MAG: homocysteine S-methyltransferase family protein [Pseudomonadota bacterium]